MWAGVKPEFVKPGLPPNGRTAERDNSCETMPVKVNAHVPELTEANPNCEGSAPSGAP
jgi:hypothetical protein